MRLRETIRKLLFPAARDDFIGPISELPSGDASAADFFKLPWTLGATGHLRQAWDQMVVWRRSVRKRGARGPLFVATVTGTAGIGKSRLAHEFALATAAETEGWDTGFVAFQRGPLDDLGAKLRAWKPRRPTLLVLDDPTALAYRVVVDALRDGRSEGRFVHPVALLVTLRDPPLGSEAGFTRSTIALTIQARFDREEDISPPFEVTKGIPFAVELATERLRRGEATEEENIDAWIDARAVRIMRNLAARRMDGVGPLVALAASTLVRGAPTQGVIDIVLTNFGQAPGWPMVAELRACLPAEPLADSDDESFPYVRPERLGDAFLDRAMAALGAGKADLVVGIAFLLDRDRAFDAVRRQWPINSAIGQALRAINSETIPGLEQMDVALALAESATCYPLGREASADAQAQIATNHAASVAIARLDTARVPEFCARFAASLSAFAASPRRRGIVASFACDLFLEAANRDGVVIVAATWIEFFRMAAREGEWDFGPTDGLRRSLAAAAHDEIDKLVEVLWRSNTSQRRVWAPAFAAARARMPEYSIRLEVLAALDAPATAQAVVDRVSVAAVADDGGAAWDLAVACRFLAFAWSDCSEGAAAAAARAAADRAEGISRLSPGDPTIMREVAEARAYETRAWARGKVSDSGESLRTARARVEAIRNRYPDDVVIARMTAAALSDEATFLRHDGDEASALGARAVAAKIGILGNRFPEDIEIAVEFARATVLEAWAWSCVPEGAKAEEAYEAGLRVSALETIFPDEPRIARAWARARRFEAYAWSQAQGYESCVKTSISAGRVEMRSLVFPGDITIQLELAEARLLEAKAASSADDEEDRFLVGIVARAVERIHARLAILPSLGETAAQALAYEAYAWTRSSDETAAEKIAAIAARIDAIAARHPDVVSIEREAVRVRMYEADVSRATRTKDGA